MEVKLSTRFKARSALFLFVIVLCFAFGATIASAATCVAGTCDGQNPNTYGCGADAVYGAAIKKIYIGTTQVGEVHNRTSTFCQAQWERTYNTTAAKYAEGSIRWGGTTYNVGGWPVSSPGTITSGATVYTPMYGIGGVGAASLVCGNLSTTGPIFAPSMPPSTPSPTYKTNKCQAN